MCRCRLLEKTVRGTIYTRKIYRAKKRSVDRKNAKTDFSKNISGIKNELAPAHCTCRIDDTTMPFKKPRASPTAKDASVVDGSSVTQGGVQSAAGKNNSTQAHSSAKWLTNASIGRLFGRRTNGILNENFFGETYFLDFIFSVETVAASIDDGLANLAGFLEKLDTHLPPIEEDDTDTADTEPYDDGSMEEDASPSE